MTGGASTHLYNHHNHNANANSKEGGRMELMAGGVGGRAASMAFHPSSSSPHRSQSFRLRPRMVAPECQRRHTTHPHHQQDVYSIHIIPLLLIFHGKLKYYAKCSLSRIDRKKGTYQKKKKKQGKAGIWWKNFQSFPHPILHTTYLILLYI